MRDIARAVVRGGALLERQRGAKSGAAPVIDEMFGSGRSRCQYVVEAVVETNGNMLSYRRGTCCYARRPCLQPLEALKEAPHPCEHSNALPIIG